MTTSTIPITCVDRDWHEPFLRFIPRVFPGVCFRAWYRYGGWNERYTAFAVVEDDAIVASASLFALDVLLQGERVRGLQLGAVGTLASHRGRGLQARVMARALAQAGPSELVFLFANDSVLDFYPRFGFERARESVFRVAQHVRPAGAALRALAIEDADDRAILQRLGQRAVPATTRFGARDYGSLVLWYWSNFYPGGLRYAPELDAIFVVEQRRDRLYVLDVLAATTVDLGAQLPRLITAPITTVELGFAPSEYFPDARPVAEYTEAALFVRGPQRLPRGPFKYPVLAQT